MTRVEWRFAATRDDGGILVNAINADMPELYPGASMTLELEYWDDRNTDAVDEPGMTFGGASGGTFGGDDGGTYGGATGHLRGHRIRYRETREYCRYAGRAATNQTIDGTVKYRERLPDDATVPSIVVALKPSGYLSARQTPGLWVLLDSYDDPTDNIPDIARIEAEVTFLATTHQYPTKTALEAELGT